MAVREPHVQKEWLKQFKNLEKPDEWTRKRIEELQMAIISIR